MKSKIKKNHILIKGITILILLITVTSLFSNTVNSYAQENEDNDGDCENIEGSVLDDEGLDSPSTDDVIQSLKIDIAELQSKLNKLIDDKDDYTKFIEELKNSNTIEISNEIQLRALSLFVAEGNNCNGKTFIIVDNIEVTSSIEWDPIGSSDNKFKGIIDGRGHTISGISITKKQSNVGFIGYADKATIKNLTIANSNIDIKPNIEDTLNDLASSTDIKYSSAGIFAGVATNSNFINCINKSNITAGSNVGGIVGLIDGNSKIDNCTNEGIVKGYSRVGGIVGLARQNSKDYTLIISNCINKKTVFGTAIDVGGIVGILKYNCKVIKCQNSGTVAVSTDKVNLEVLGNKVTINPQNVGGIVGTSGGNNNYYDKTNNNVVTLIEYCINDENSNVYGYKDVGGIIGQLGNISKGYSRVNNSINYSSKVKASQKYYVGGIAGAVGGTTDNAHQTGRIYNCYYFVSLSKESYESSAINTLAIRSKQQTESVINANAGEIGAFGKLYGSDGDNETPNICFKVIKDNNKYYYESRVHYVNESNKVKIKNRTLYTPSKYEGGKGVWWIRTEEINEEGNVYYPKATSEFLPHTEGLEPVNTEEKKEKLESYQHWLYCLSNNGRLVSDSNNKIVIDNSKPKVEKITLATESNSSIAVVDDTMIFKVKFTENINKYAVEPTLHFNFRYYDNATKNYNMLPRIAKFVGIDGNVAIFKYVVQKTDVGLYNDKTENRIVRNVNISENLFKDVFGYGNEAKSFTTIEDDDFVVLKSEFHKSKTYSSSVSKEKIGVSIGYRFYDENGRTGFSGARGYIRDGFNLRVYINKNILSNIGNTDEVKLYIKLKESDKLIEHVYNSNKGDGEVNDEIVNGKNDSTTSIYFRNIDTGKMNGTVEEVYFTINSKVTIGDNLVNINEENTKASITNIYLDNKIPEISQSISSKNNYCVGDKITIKLKINDEYELEEIKSDNIPNLKIKFGTGEDKIITPSKVENFENGKETDIYYEYTIQEGDNGLLSIVCEGNKNVKDIAGNIALIPVEFNLKTAKYADTTSPTVAITAKKVQGEDKIEIANSITNADVLEYTFDWSEEVNNFTVEDITVNGGRIVTNSKLTKDTLDKTKYTLQIESNVSKGNEGNIQVIVEQNACQDHVGLSNIRSESILKIDKKSPAFIGLEGYAETTIELDPNVDTVKQYYKAGDTITIIATFNESIASLEENLTGLPKITLAFSESGKANGSVNSKLEGNKIIYTYKITDEDAGILSVKGFTGKVIDSAGNETQVTKRTLDGDTIIACTTAPKLDSIAVVAPEFKYNDLLSNHETETKRYGVGQEINFYVSFDKDVYELSDGIIKNINDYSVPKLKIQFGMSAEEKEAEFENIKGNVIHYSYIISDGDNGDLSIKSLSGAVWDEAGNKFETTNSTRLPENIRYEKQISNDNIVERITADTTRPSFNITTNGINYDDNGNTITGTGDNYRKGGVITITVTTDEFVYKKAEDKLEDFTKDTMNFISLKFGEVDAKGIITCEEVNYSNSDTNKTMFKYKYIIQEGDNGTLEISIAEDSLSDIALNGNVINVDELSVVADTINPTYGDYNNIVYDNGAYKVTFNEELYSLDDNNNRIVAIAPKLKFEDDTTEIDGTVATNIITYTTSKLNKKGYLSGNSKLCDKAGNLYAYFDNVAPILDEIKVVSPVTGTYKVGTEIAIQAIFSEKIKGTIPTLMIQFGDGDSRTISIGKIIDNRIEYKYTIQNGDNGELHITDYKGNGLTDISNNVWTRPETLPTLRGNKIIADTIAPTVTITSDVERTNGDTVKYTFTWSKSVTNFTKDDIELTNGLKGEFEEVKNSQGKVYTLKVDKQAEGMQIVRVLPNVCEDLVGNLNNEKTVYNKVFVDCTKPIIRAKVNGGNYVVGTENEKSILKEKIVVNEELSKFEYIWSASETIPTTGFEVVDVSSITVDSDINIVKEISLGENQDKAEYYLYIKVTDLAGNVLEAKTNKFIINNSSITLTPDKTQATKEDVVVTVSYDDALTENRKAGISGKTQSVDSSKVIVSENGTVYAEATDKAGNKVYKIFEITNIDKTAPEATITYETNENKSVTATISFNEEEVTITNNNTKNTYTFTENGEFTFEFQDKAGNKGTALAKVESIVPLDENAPTLTFKYVSTTITVGNKIDVKISTNEDAKISYSWDNKNWSASENYTTTVNVEKTPTQEGKYTLYAKAVDESGNTSDIAILEFTVVKAIENVEVPEIIFEELPIVQVGGKKYVKISAEMDSKSVTAKMNKTALKESKPVYTNLTDDKKLKTGSEITLNGETKYIIIVNGDVNCDGKIDFLGDIITSNNYRIGITTLNTIQKLAADINNDGKVEFISDILAMNNYRIGITNSL